MGESDAQRKTPVGGCDVPLGSQGPGPRAPAAARFREVEHGRGDLVHGSHSGPGDLKHQFGAAEDLAGGPAPGVVARGVDREGGLAAGGV